MAILTARKIGTMIRRARQDAGYTQETLAAEAKIRTATLSDIEQGRFFPSYQSLVAICDKLKLDMNLFRQPPVDVVDRNE